MENKTILSKAASMLRQVLGKPTVVPTPGEEPKPIEPTTPVTPVESIK